MNTSQIFSQKSENIAIMHLLDFGFRQTLKVRTLGCMRRSHLLPTHVSLPRQDLKLHEEQHKGHEIYTGQATIVV